jgi:hypothetical protein
VVIPQPGGPIHFVLRVGDCFWDKEKTMVADFKWRMGFCKNMYMGSLFCDDGRQGNQLVCQAQGSGGKRQGSGSTKSDPNSDPYI